MNSQDTETRWVFITGASSGIGLALAKEFAQHGYSLIITARSTEQLAQIASEIEREFHVSVRFIAADLADTAKIQSIFLQLSEWGVIPEILINNAGFAVYGEFSQTELAAELSLIDVNIRALTEITKRFIHLRLASGFGRILNVASTAAFQPGPLMAVYFASKAYVLHFSEALAEELKQTNITVSILCPGPTETGFAERAKLTESKLFQQSLMTAEDVAKQGYNGLMKGKTLIITGIKNKILAQSYRFAPRFMIPRVVRIMQEKKHTGA